MLDLCDGCIDGIVGRIKDRRCDCYKCVHEEEFKLDEPCLTCRSNSHREAKNG